MGPNESRPAIARNDQVGGTASIIKARALIVDDESAERRHLHELLAGHPEIELLGECADGHEALDAIQEKSPDLLLLDIKMPALDGFAVVEGIQTEPRPTIIFVTG